MRCSGWIRKAHLRTYSPRHLKHIRDLYLILLAIRLIFSIRLFLLCLVSHLDPVAILHLALLNLQLLSRPSLVVRWILIPLLGTGLCLVISLQHLPHGCPYIILVRKRLVWCCVCPQSWSLMQPVLPKQSLTRRPPPSEVLLHGR